MLMICWEPILRTTYLDGAASRPDFGVCTRQKILVLTVLELARLRPTVFPGVYTVYTPFKELCSLSIAVHKCNCRIMLFARPFKTSLRRSIILICPSLVCRGAVVLQTIKHSRIQVGGLSLRGARKAGFVDDDVALEYHAKHLAQFCGHRM